MNLPPRQIWPAIMAAAAAWLWTWLHLATEWRLNQQYEYGFAVPLLAMMLLLSRLPSAGDAHPQDDATKRTGLTMAWLSLIPLFAGEFIRQADPFWRLSGWLLHAGATLLTLGTVLSIGGRTWFRVAIIPVLFLTLAVPWPSAIEGRLTNGLLATATRIAVDCLNWLGIPSLQRGNVIELSNGLVGIDEACSGIQSLLSSLMASVFLGAYLRLSYLRRAFLVIAGVGTAVIGNVIRIIVLTKAVHVEGRAGFDKAHDPVGMWASMGIFLTLGLLAWLLRPKSVSTPEKRSAAWPTIPFPSGLFILIAVLLVPFLVGALWRAIAGNTRDVLEAPHWIVRAEPPPAGWAVRKDSFTLEEQRLLQFTEGGAWLFQRDMGVPAYIVHMFWSSDRTIPSEAFGHSAQICMPSSGWKSLGDPSTITVTVGTNQISGTLGYFELEGDRQAVFQATWRGTSLKPAMAQLTTSRWSRLQALEGAYRQRGHEMLSVYLPVPVVAENPPAVFSAFLSLVLTANTNNPTPSGP